MKGLRPTSAPLPAEGLDPGQLLALDVFEGGVGTLGGLVFAMAGRVPLRGEVLTHSSGWRFTVMEADPRRIRRVHIELASNPLRRRRRLTPPEPVEVAPDVTVEGAPDTPTNADQEPAPTDAAEVEGTSEGPSEAAAKPRVKPTPKPKPKPAAKPKAKPKSKATAPAQAAGD